MSDKLNIPESFKIFDLEEPETCHRRYYNNIKVDISNKDTIDIMPVENTTWLRCDKEEVIYRVNKLKNDNDTFMNIPKYQWLIWFEEPFR